jgi:hypothetical protein
MGAEEGSLFPACSLQGAVQLQRVRGYGNRNLACEPPHPEEARSAVSKDGAAHALMLRDAAPERVQDARERERRGSSA